MKTVSFADGEFFHGVGQSAAEWPMGARARGGGWVVMGLDLEDVSPVEGMPELLLWECESTADSGMRFKTAREWEAHSRRCAGRWWLCSGSDWTAELDSCAGKFDLRAARALVIVAFSFARLWMGGEVREELGR